MLHHEETGTGTPIVFLHGNPSSSHSWRHVLPHVGGGRLLAPDLIGMGRSPKPDIAYTFADHAQHLDAWFDALGLDDVVLVGHDWGGALAFDWAARNPGRVRGVAFFETIVKPMAWDDLTPQAAERSRKIRTPGAGEEMVLTQDLFIRQAFTGGVRTPVGDDDLAAYLAPFPTPESRRPVLAWARQLPLGGDPAELVTRIEAYDEWLATSESTPKLLLTFEGSPTLLIGEKMAQWCADHIAGLEVVAGGEAGHHAQEDRPKEIAAEIAAWLDRHGLR
ncbi:haloalkane dehalogenase [Amycolatopsis mediterranei S699]|uniref:Haloalkane dehalogenase n=3 Tax=Amycolatopsis mediterranei TaxID=33910 RepID=A0A0H3DBT6_AMYMU|nr:haloalkane dehalogenase [Amycolatopsis mediterranei]ADJ48131.1 haloalkane dehalogenase [Amycolatopsis mediterranei U32]AEK45033.1 haloalkane dehalogenase [Amycolatopsis mediterranei S699]AFO79842.1 haloalkane dehalogenase [Amycolatopsis mediterranei S699]AGT86970.1 haloalkane dehalogenase [Amycolatopsis mediterranei RB]KDO10616.1 haloalkane dehalogenase [Amycolatopsis mediterranei]